MSEFKGTVGPWKVVPFVDATIIESNSDSGYGTKICEMHGRPEHFDNARLISASLDLLVACEAALKAMINDYHNRPRIGVEDACRACKDAITKALGN